MGSGDGEFFDGGADRGVAVGVEMDANGAAVEVIEGQSGELLRQGFPRPDAGDVLSDHGDGPLPGQVLHRGQPAPAARRPPLRLEQPLDVQEHAAGRELRRHGSLDVGERPEGGEAGVRQPQPRDRGEDHQPGLRGDAHGEGCQQPPELVAHRRGHGCGARHDLVACRWRLAAEGVAAERHHHHIRVGEVGRRPPPHGRLQHRGHLRPCRASQPGAGEIVLQADRACHGGGRGAAAQAGGRVLGDPLGVTAS